MFLHIDPKTGKDYAKVNPAGGDPKAKAEPQKKKTNQEKREEKKKNKEEAKKREAEKAQTAYSSSDSDSSEPETGGVSIAADSVESDIDQSLNLTGSLKA